MSSGVRRLGVRGKMRGIRLIAFGSRIYVQVDLIAATSWSAA